jgi:CMP-N-acetylneuraminic acid synthetase
MKKNITAIIVARKNSKRLKKKNTRFFKKIQSINESLISIKIKNLKKITEIKEIVVGSDDPLVEKIANKLNVKFIKRKSYFCNENLCSANEMIKNVLSYIKSDIIVWTHCTNPFINNFHIAEAIKIFNKLDKKKYDSLFCASELRGHFYNNLFLPINHNPQSEKHAVANSLEPILQDNGSIFIRKYKDMMKDGCFVGKKPYIFVVNKFSGWDIDTKTDFEIAKVLYKKFIK